MTMANFVFVDETGLIVNRVVADDSADCFPPEGSVAVAETNEERPMTIGGTLIDGIYAPPLHCHRYQKYYRNRYRIDSFSKSFPSKAGSQMKKRWLQSRRAQSRLRFRLLSIVSRLRTSSMSGATVFERNHPPTIAIGEAQEISSAQIDDFFGAACAL
jgi:hypothetical protein